MTTKQITRTCERCGVAFTRNGSHPYRFCSVRCINRSPLSDAQRFWSKVNKTETCWLWTAGKNTDGYGVFHLSEPKRLVRAHRWAYIAILGPIHNGLTLDHLCRVRHCVNPSHLEPVTDRENLLRGISPLVVNARRTHCIHGHEFTPENTSLTPDGRRNCKACKRKAVALRRARQKESITEPVCLLQQSLD
jgi:hypothetical protein